MTTTDAIHYVRRLLAILDKHKGYTTPEQQATMRGARRLVEEHEAAARVVAERGHEAELADLLGLTLVESASGPPVECKPVVFVHEGGGPHRSCDSCLAVVEPSGDLVHARGCAAVQMERAR